MISADKALRIVLDHTRTLEADTVPVPLSFDMVLAQDIVAADDYPPFDKATIDGFALRSADIAASDRVKPSTLILDGEVRVGDTWETPLLPGHAVKVASGALLPDGADTVISGDYAVRESSKKVKIYKNEKPGEHIVIKGDDIEAGSLVFPKGRILNAADIGLLSGLGFHNISCYRKPRVAFFASGNDLIAPESPHCQGKFHPSAFYALHAQLLKYGAHALDLGIFKLDPELVKTRIDEARKGDMMVVTSGGSSGDFDYLKTILQKYGMDLKFWRVAIRPGKPFVFGMFDGIPVFGISDNLLSSMVVLEYFIRPSIMKMQGKAEDRRMEVKARLDKDIKGSDGITQFIRAEVRLTANGFITLPPHIPGVAAGELVNVQIISDYFGSN